MMPDDILTAIVHDLSNDSLGWYEKAWKLILDLSKLTDESNAEDLTDQPAHENRLRVYGSSTLSLLNPAQLSQPLRLNNVHLVQYLLL